MTALVVDLGRGITARFTRREGGVSSGPWQGLNLALHVGDAPSDVARNRAAAGLLMGAPVLFGHQVHGVRVAVLGDVPAGHDPITQDLAVPDGDGSGIDALVATTHQLAIGVLVADCVPVLLADPVSRVVAVAHAGRQGLLDGVVGRTVAAMVASGAVVARIRAALRPAAGGCCYEVPGWMRDDACARVPAARAVTRWGTPSLDLRSACAAILRDGGVAEVTLVGGCTIDDPGAYSYRRERQTGRFAGLIRLQQ